LKVFRNVKSDKCYLEKVKLFKEKVPIKIGRERERGKGEGRCGFKKNCVL